MQYVNEDVQILIFSYLEPEDIIASYELIPKQLISHIGFEVYCKKIVSEETISWFEQKKIKIHLLIEKNIRNNGITWRRNGKTHRDNDLPAVIADDYRIWWYNGLVHRDNDLPAFIMGDSDEIKEWYQRGELHRDNDLPAYINENGTQKWYQHGLLHRDDNKPAIIHYDGSTKFYVHGVKK